jgi:hypothetical protein
MKSNIVQAMARAVALASNKAHPLIVNPLTHLWHVISAFSSCDILFQNTWNWQCFYDLHSWICWRWAMFFEKQTTQLFEFAFVISCYVFTLVFHTWQVSICKYLWDVKKSSNWKWLRLVWVIYATFVLSLVSIIGKKNCCLITLHEVMLLAKSLGQY